MRLLWLELADFRSYHVLRFEPAEGVNILLGPNGAGKTNLLEGVGFLASTRSFRSAPEQALIAHGADSAVIRAEVERGSSVSLLEFELSAAGRRRVLVNRQRLARLTDLLGYLRAIPFLPEDLDIVKGGPGVRRQILDEVAVQLWPAAGLDQHEFERALKQRNAFLRQSRREGADQATLEVWDVRVSQAGGRVMERRASVVRALQTEWGQCYSSIAGRDSEVTVSYQSSWGGEIDPAVGGDQFATRLLGALTACRRADLERGQTTSGPHRDEPRFSLDGHDSRFHASQGEQRALALSLRLAAHQAVTVAAGSPPVLLLDDVFSELDPDRSARLVGALPLAQTLITSARPEDVPISGHRWRVMPGLIS